MKNLFKLALVLTSTVAFPLIVFVQEGPPLPSNKSPFRGNLFTIAQQQPVSYEAAISKILLSEGKTSSANLIQIRENVKSHAHESHDEIVYIISGKGIMTINHIKRVIKAGDFIAIDRNSAHSVKCKSAAPLVALSVMSPPFDGIDRVFTESSTGYSPLQEQKNE